MRIDIPKVFLKRLRRVPTLLNPHLMAILESDRVVCFSRLFTFESLFVRIMAATDPILDS